MSSARGPEKRRTVNGTTTTAGGRMMMKAGSCFYQPPRIRHRELRHSKNLEMIEVVGPANFKTYSVPAARKSPARRSPS